MNKIYNNLNINNLIKTDWFNQFNEYQQEEILEGLEKNLDISWYANSKLDKEQMQQIRLGLEDNLDVFLYAKKEFNVWQMEEIRLKLLKESTLK